MVDKQTATYFKRMMLLPLLLLFQLLFWPGSVSLAKDTGYVFDRAELFSREEQAELEKMAEELEEDYHMNFLMLTAEDAHGLSSRELAEEFYEEGGYDTNGKRGGIVLLIDMDNRELNLVTSGDMIYYITDEREERIYDAGYAYAGEAEYGSSMKAMLEKTAEYMKKGIQSNQYTYDTETGRIKRYRSLTLSDWLLAAGGALLAAALACFIVRRRYRTVEKYEYSVGQNADIRITAKEDRLVNQLVTHRRIPRTPPPGSGAGGGSFSGRSSTHTSHGGGTFGGGHGRKF